MHLSINKRFDFEASHRLFAPDRSDRQNEDLFGKAALSRYGHGHNYSAGFVFSGPVDDRTGMMINVVDIKDKVKPVIDARYDHKFLNLDTPPYDKVVPTAENVALGLLGEVAALFDQSSARPVACHLIESPDSEATAYLDGRAERHLWIDFSAARRTHSPNLTERENRDLFGIAASPSGHGHHYRLRVTLAGDVDKTAGTIFPPAEARRILQDFKTEYDHRNLSTDIPQLGKIPMTTEMLSRHFYAELRAHLPVARLKLYENDRFFVECDGDTRVRMGVVAPFHAAHRLHALSLSESDNVALYGKCNNLYGHGHRYTAEATLIGEVDDRSGTVYSLVRFTGEMDAALADWDYKHLDIETDDFRDRPSTGENIVAVLWSKLERNCDAALDRVRLWETPNNRFTLRRNPVITT